MVVVSPVAAAVLAGASVVAVSSAGSEQATRRAAEAPTAVTARVVRREKKWRMRWSFGSWGVSEP